MPTHLCNKHVYNMNFCRWPVVRSTADGRPTPKMSSDCRSIVSRLTADGLSMPNRGVPTSGQLCIFLMWMRVVARFERVGLGKSADKRLKVWSPDQKFNVS